MSKPNWSIDGDTFQVLRNAEEQYSLWPSAQTPPGGWTAVGSVGSKAECLQYIEANWTDMRPKSLRVQMGEDA
ncbi:MAG: MbtH family NRPS accessory protein [Pseudomonadota bacterium]